MIRLPIEEALEEYISPIGAKYPRLQERRVWGAADGLKIKIQQSLNWLIQSRFYNTSWVCDTYDNSVFVFAADGRICICCYNCPGTWHDSTIADHGVYDKIEELFIKLEAMVCVDSVFRVATGRHQCLVQSLQTDLDTIEAILLNAEATSLCQLSEWGMRMIQGKFVRLKDKLLLETFGDRKIILNLMMLLYNYQTNTIDPNEAYRIIYGYFGAAGDNTPLLDHVLELFEAILANSVVQD
eukprot:jgi/Psemu1/6958/gm1.6958_g